ncbi:protein phosphatase 1 regulatory subunit 26 [Rhinoderma darwinii]|uniref:protein phosphatase 1 regulatory subunit 26 n=1 Tax=Rhinoderma darwinii TaxID=43563 RepID=UPI003F661B34
MFLLNAPPLAAFQTQWTPFGCNAPCRVPTSLPPPAQLANIPVVADVEGAINSPLSDESSLTVKVEYERIMQKNGEGEFNIGRELKSSPDLFIGHVREEAALIVPEQFQDLKEEGSDFGALVLDSDSDDSVHRDIEEAIQEYLKNRPIVKTPKSIENDGDKVKAAQNNSPARKSPVKMVTSPKLCDSFTVSRCSSPDSVGSDDSFEQSINKEIEQFLIEKKLQNNASEPGTSKKAKLKPKPIKAVEKPSRKQRVRGPAVKTVSASLNLLPKNPKPKAESCSSNNIRLKLVSGPCKPNVPSRPPPPLPPAPCVGLSDSDSSDDGIEEAIQLYQLEKNRLGVSLNSAHRTSPAITTLDLSPCRIKNSPPKSKKKTTNYRKRKLPNAKAAASQDFTSCHTIASKRAFHSGGDRNLDDEPEEATRRVETAAELMCAEAILDISKAILPSQPERSLAVSREKQSAQPASPCASDSSVDSDDSIEQEIRTFLARKAQTKSVGTSSAKKTAKERRSEPPKQPSLPNNKAVTTGKDKVVLKDSSGKGSESWNVNSSPVNPTLPIGKHLQGNTTATCPEESSQPHRQAQHAEHHIIRAMASLDSSSGVIGDKRTMYVKGRSNCSGDKSSSLDSDEDLHSAIKDLLRSKRKCKKRPKDGRPPCKKKVRFGETTTRPLEMLGTVQKECMPKPLVVKSCLVTSNDLKENSLKKSKTTVKLKEEKKISVGNTELSSVGRPVESAPACASDKSVKLSNALPETQDSSSVDSNDSIEQEIRKYLSNCARGSSKLPTAQRTTATVIAPTAIKTETTPVRISNPAPIKKEPGVLSSSVTETILQKVREKDRSAAPKPAVIQRLYSYDRLSQVARLQHPTGIAKGTAPVHGVIIKRECIVDQSRIVRPTEKPLPAAPGRVIVKTGVNGSQGNIPISGNFVAGLKYISGTEQQLLLNVGNAGTTRLATDFYTPGRTIAQLGSCQAVQKNTLILEQPKVIQSPAFSLGAPMARPALYVVTTKVVQETSASLCLPLNRATYDSGLNLMSIQYCPGQVAARTSACAAPFSFQQTRNSETRVITPGKAGEIPTLLTKARESQATSGLLDGGSNFANVNERATEDFQAGSSVQKDQV